jgi:hypothetical protein
MLGHASAAMTLDIYADLFDDDLEAVATALDEARARESMSYAPANTKPATISVSRGLGPAPGQQRLSGTRTVSPPSW